MPFPRKRDVIRPHTRLVTARDAQKMFPTCKVCGQHYNKGKGYADHVKTSVAHAKAVRNY